MERRYEVAKFGERKWGIVYRLDARTSFDKKVRYATKREAVLMVFELNRDLDATGGRGSI